MYWLYRFSDKDNNVIYVGKTTNSIKSRIDNHLSMNGHLPFECYDSINTIEALEVNNEYELLVKEIVYIGSYKPKYNIQYKLKENITKELKELLSEDTWEMYLTRDNINEHLLIKRECNRKKLIEDNINSKAMQQEVERALSEHICLM